MFGQWATTSKLSDAVRGLLPVCGNNRISGGELALPPSHLSSFVSKSLKTSRFKNRGRRKLARSDISGDIFGGNVSDRISVMSLIGRNHLGENYKSTVRLARVLCFAGY